MIRYHLFFFPLLLAGAEGDFVGAKRCAPCHESILRRQQSSRHARTLRPMTDASEFSAHLPYSTVDRSTGAQLTLTRTGTGAVELIASKEIERYRLPLQWAFGSGAQGITCVGKREDGQPIEGRLTWYQSIDTYDLTTGATRYTPFNTQQSLGRELSTDELQRCLTCHGGERVELGVRCETCHGPGSKHVASIGRSGSNLSILNPGRLDAFGQAKMCGECHGTPPEDTDLAGLRAIEGNPNTVRFASPRLVLSRCFNESENGLKCTGCHNPHEDASREHADYDRACLSCHSTNVRKRAAVCKTGVERCASCHMPRVRVMAHSKFADHWIRVVR